ncbi:MAG: 30S ribosome-binding factor RbfA [Micrococcales bacterium]|nr:30S ribosome-binding factor RbfA [Micrococcales bacterium]
MPDTTPARQRPRRLADRIREIVAEMINSGRVKDHRLGFITITEVRVSGDLQHATVFYTVLGDAHQRELTAQALASARGVLRSEVGRQTGVRLTPTLAFQLDELPEGASHIEDVLREARARDARLAEQAATAHYAGDPDPYRHPPEDPAPSLPPTDDGAPLPPAPLAPSLPPTDDGGPLPPLPPPGPLPPSPDA